MVQVIPGHLHLNGQFAHLLEFKRLKGRKTQTADKVKVAHRVVKEQADLSVLDLKKMVEKTVAFIREANDGE